MTAAQRGELALSGSAAAAGHADGRHDFDFIFGRWQVHNRKLADVADSGSWNSADASVLATLAILPRTLTAAGTLTM